MAKLTISNLDPMNSNPLSDSASYIRELSPEELNIQGGLLPAVLIGLAILLYPTDAY